MCLSRLAVMFQEGASRLAARMILLMVSMDVC